jgi:hypothetical protein
MSNQQQYPQGPQQQWHGQQQWQGQPPPPVKPKKKHPILMAFAAGASALVVLAVAVAAFGDDPQTDPAGAAGPSSSAPAPQPSQPTNPAKPAPKPSPSKPAPKPSATQPTEQSGDSNAPATVKVGQSIVIGKHQILPGWKVTKADYLDTFEVTAKVKNISDETSSSLMEMKFLKGNEVVGDVMLTSDPLEPGQVQKLNGLSGDEFVKYDRITVEAMF